MDLEAGDSAYRGDLRARQLWITTATTKREMGEV